MPNHLLWRDLKSRRVALVNARIRDDDVESPCYALDLINRSLVVLLVGRNDLEDVYAAGVRFDEGIKLGSVSWVTSARKDNSIRPGGQRGDNGKA